MLKAISVAVGLFVSACAAELGVQPNADDDSSTVDVGVVSEELTACENNAYRAAIPYFRQKITAPFSNPSCQGPVQYNDPNNIIVFTWRQPCPPSSSSLQQNWSVYGNQQSSLTWRYFSQNLYYPGHILQCTCSETTGPARCNWIS